MSESEKATIEVTENNLYASVEKVLHPEIDTVDYPVVLYEDEAGLYPVSVSLRLRALPIKQSRHFAKMVKDVDSDKLLEDDVLSEFLAGICVHMFSSYGVKGVTKEVVMHSLDMEGMRELIRKQMEVCKSSDFLLTPLLAILNFIDQIEKHRDRLTKAELNFKDKEAIDVTETKQLPEPTSTSPAPNGSLHTPATVSPGESALTN